MSRLRSKWLSLAACVVAGALLVTIPSLQALHGLMQVADALSSGIQEGLRESGGDPRHEPARVTVAFLFGLVEIKDTPHPYLWTALSGVVTGGILGAVVWCCLQLGLRVWRRRRARAN